MANSRTNWFVGTLLTLCTIGLVIGMSAQSPPGPPSGLIASITGAASYVLGAGSAPCASNLGQFPTASPGLAASAPPGIYYVRARARSACGSGPASNEVIVTVQ